MSGAFTLGAPLQGWAAPLAETPDPVFAERMMGDGLAIDPTVGEVRAPCDGEVVALHAAAHAVTLRGREGAEVLIHVGLETVALGGAGFEALARVGEMVAAGQPLLRFDLDLVARRAASLISPVVVVNGHEFVVEDQVTGREVQFGEPVLTLRPAAPTATAMPSGTGAGARVRVRVGLAHGLHARPAALLAREAGRFAAETSVVFAGRRANARSPVSVMALGVRRDDDIELSAQGADAEAAVTALAATLQGVEASPAPAAAVILAAPAQPSSTASPLGVLEGVPAAPGLAIGAAVRLFDLEPQVNEVAGGADVERPALAAALASVRNGLERMLVAGAGEGREIVDAHLAFLADPELRRTAESGIDGGASAGVAWRDAIAVFVEELRRSGDARMMERAADLADLERQVLMALAGETLGPPVLPDNAVVFADDLLPSQLMALDPARLAGLAISRSGPTSHVAILAAAMGVPAVVALGPRLLAIEDGALVILDGDEGRMQVAPKPTEIAAAQTRLFERRDRKARALAAAREPGRTADDVRIEVFANLGAVTEAADAVEAGAEGCGLLRTEFLFLECETPPDEAAQLASYQAIGAALAGRPLVVRTLDLGADKPVPYLPLPEQPNPALGLRGLRVGLAWPEVLRTQLRAILKVTPAGQVRIMFPMVASLAEFRAGRRLAAELAAELGVDVPEVGVMVETPAAAVTADLLAAEADFLSIGTNDLAQYTLAMDRTSQQLAAQVDALHPAVLRLIRQTAQGAARHGRTIAACGGLASDPAAAPILVGLGVTELSAAPAAIPEIKAAVRAVTLAQCRDLAERALALASAAEVRALRPAAIPPSKTGATP